MYLIRLQAPNVPTNNPRAAPLHASRAFLDATSLNPMSYSCHRKLWKVRPVLRTLEFLGAMFPGFASKLFSNPSAIVKLSQSRAWPLARGLGELYDVWSRLNSCVASCCIASPFIPKKGNSKWCVLGLPVTHTKWVTPSLRLLMADAEIWGPPTGPPENVTKHVRYPPVN